MATNSWQAGGGIFNFGTEGQPDPDWSIGVTPTSTQDAVVNTGGSGLLLGATTNEDVNSISLGSNDALLIDSGSIFTAQNGTGPNVNNGTININGADLVIGNTSSTATFDNGSSGSIVLNGTGASATAAVIISGSVNLTGAGSIEMTIGDPVGDNLITGNFIHATTLTNKTEDISGSGTIGGGLNFTNEAKIETNNSTSSSAGTLVIEGSAAGGGFTNTSTGFVEADNGGTLLLGADGFASSIGNNGGTIGLDGNTSTTTLKVAGNLTISGSSTGSILLGGPDASFDLIVSDGKTASLTLVNQQLKGAGFVGDSNLTLNNQSLIDADIAGKILLLRTGTNTIANSVGATMEGDDGILSLGSPVNNGGTIQALQGGEISVLGAITGSGAVDIGTNGVLDVIATISGNVTFTGSGAELIIANDLANGGIGGEVLGVAVSDVIDFSSVVAHFSASNSLHWNQTSVTGGVLSVVNSSGTTLAFIVLAGSFIVSDFSMSAAGADTLATITASVPWSTPQDYNDDGISDVLWRNSSDDSLVTWLMNGSSISSSAYVTSGGSKIEPDSSWSVAGTGDFNGDGDADVLWRQSTTGSLVTWLMNGSTISSSAFVTSGGSAVAPDSTWSVMGLGDFNGDGDADVLWRQSTTGSLVTWFMNGSAIASSADVTLGGNPVNLDSSWSVVGVGDFNGDGNADVLWRQSTTGSLVTWQMNGSAIASSAFVTSSGSTVAPDSSWSVVGVGDFNGDGDADVLWRQSTTGSLAMWLMNGSTIASSAFVTSGGNPVMPDSTWNVVEVGDFNGTNQAGILWQQSTTGTLVEWQMNGAQIASAQTVTSGGNPVAPATSWQVQANPTDFT